MKKILLTFVIAAASLAASAQAPALTTLADSLSYFIGNTEGAYTRTTASQTSDASSVIADFDRAIKYVFDLPDSSDGYLRALGRAIELRTNLSQMRQAGCEVNNKLFYDAYLAGLNGPTLPEGELREQINMTQHLMNRAQDELRAQEEAKLAAQKAANAEAANTFMTALKKKEKKNLHTTVSGLSYKVNKKGYGPFPKETDKVKVHYTGKLLDGTVFDSSVERGEPATFNVNGLIKGFTEGLMLMNPGAKYTFYIPAELAYGDKAAGDKITPGSMLVFDVELIEINPEN